MTPQGKVLRGIRSGGKPARHIHLLEKASEGLVQLQEQFSPHLDRLLLLIQFVRLAYLELRKVDDKGETNIIDAGLVLLILRNLFVQ